MFHSLHAKKSREMSNSKITVEKCEKQYAKYQKNARKLRDPDAAFGRCSSK